MSDPNRREFFDSATKTLIAGTVAGAAAVGAGQAVSTYKNNEIEALRRQPFLPILEGSADLSPDTLRVMAETLAKDPEARKRWRQAQDFMSQAIKQADALRGPAESWTEQVGQPKAKTPDRLPNP